MTSSEKKRIGRPPTHGMTKSPTYASFKSMHGRCYSKTNASYPRYGGVGIYVVERWHRFENFLADLGMRPSRRHSVHREGNAPYYGPDVCRWATSTEQNREKSSNRVIECSGESRCLAEWSELSGVRSCTIAQRLDLGWPAERAIFEPAREMSDGVEWRGEKRSLCEWARILGVPRELLRGRLRDGWDVDRAFTTPAGFARRMIEHDGKRMSLSEWARTAGLHKNTLRERLDRGLPMDMALLQVRAE